MIASDVLIKMAIGCLQDHLDNHPDRDGNSVGYRIEQAIRLLEEAQRMVVADAPRADAPRELQCSDFTRYMIEG